MEERGGAIMVSKILRSSVIRSFLACVLASALLAVLTLTAVMAQGVGTTSDFTIEEAYTVELTANGDAHVTDVLTYDDTWFSDNGSIFKEYPNLLSRRYRDNTDVGEIENFDAKVNQNKSTVTITFDSPGYAYDMGDNWALYGFSYKPSKEKSSEMVFEGQGTMNNEFTLFEEIPFNVTTTIKFPQGTTNPKYTAADSSVTYVLPYKAAKSGNFLQNNKSVWLPIFIILILLSLILLLFVVLNSRRATAATTGIVAGPGAGMTPPPPPVSPTPTTSVPPAAPAPPVTPVAATPAPPVTPVAAAPAVEQPKMKRFCKHCGSALKESDKKFCSSCGKSLE